MRRVMAELGVGRQGPPPGRYSRRERPSKSAAFELFAALTGDSDRIDAPPYATPNLGQITQDGLQVGLHRRKLCCEQLIGKSIRLHSATPSLMSKAVIGIRSDVDHAVARGH